MMSKPKCEEFEKIAISPYEELIAYEALLLR